MKIQVRNVLFLCLNEMMDRLPRNLKGEAPLSLVV
jgi:hypothetical protein